jgi:hypothetical protein
MTNAAKASHTMPLPPAFDSPPTKNTTTTSLVTGTKEKRSILQQYEMKFGADYSDSIITKKKGKLAADDVSPSIPFARMRPELNKYYRVDTITLHNVIAIVMREYAEFSPSKILAIRLLDKDFAIFVPKVLSSKWTSLRYVTLDTIMRSRQ